MTLQIAQSEEFKGKKMLREFPKLFECKYENLHFVVICISAHLSLIHDKLRAITAIIRLILLLKQGSFINFAI